VSDTVSLNQDGDHDDATSSDRSGGGDQLSATEFAAASGFLALGDTLRAVYFAELHRFSGRPPLEMAVQLVRAGFTPLTQAEYHRRYPVIVGQADGAPLTASVSAAPSSEVVPMSATSPSRDSAIRAPDDAKSGTRLRLRTLAQARAVQFTDVELDQWARCADECVAAAESVYRIPAKVMGKIVAGRMVYVSELIPSQAPLLDQSVSLSGSVSISISRQHASQRVASFGDVSRALSLLERVWATCCPFLARDVPAFRSAVAEEYERYVTPSGLASIVFLVISSNLTANRPLSSMSDALLLVRVNMLAQQSMRAGPRCLVCGDVGHLRAECPLAPPSQGNVPDFSARGGGRFRGRGSGGGSSLGPRPSSESAPNGTGRPERRELADSASICGAFNAAAGCKEAGCKLLHVCSFHRRFSHPATQCNGLKKTGER
jgi:hypothetical protein